MTTADPTRELVVARYAEDLRWLGRVSKDIRRSVYDKGDGSSGGLRLPNEGREAHTYLHHIVSRYETLSGITFFSQGKPFDHVPDFHRILREETPASLPAHGFRWYSFLVDRDDAEGSLLFQAWSKNREKRPLPLRAFFRRLWDAEPPAFVVFYAGAHFAVTAEAIRRHPKSFYERALHVSLELPDAAHCFERCWDRVFGVDGIPSEVRNAPLPRYFKPIRRLMDAGLQESPMGASGE